MKSETIKQTPLLLVDVIDFHDVKILGGVIFTHDGFAYQKHDVLLKEYKGIDDAVEEIQEVKDKWTKGMVEIWVKNPRLWKKLFGNPDYDVQLKHYSDLEPVKTMVFTHEDALKDLFGVENRPPKPKKKHSFIRTLLINGCIWILNKLDKE